MTDMEIRYIDFYNNGYTIKLVISEYQCINLSILFHHDQLELPFLFEPKFGEEHFYGIVGFLNDHLQSPGKENETVCETGQI